MAEEVGNSLCGSSSHVPSVQEMVREDSVTVPERYVQHPKDRPQACSLLESEIPIINFSLLANGDEDETKRLDFACREWGFFQMVDHGVGEEVLEKMKGVVGSFFDLKLEEKKKYGMEEGEIEGYGQAFVVSEEQKLDWCDLLYLTTLPEKKRRLPHWPLAVHGFREAIECYSAEICKLNESILANLSMVMGMEKEALKNLQGEMNQSMRMNYYPPCSRPDAVLGISPHSDGNLITYLLQEDHVTGLQIRHNGGWIPVKPIPNAIVVNVGDTLEIWSNGLFKSIEHRAVTNENRARLSVATFMFPDGEVEVCPVETTVPRLYKSIKYNDYKKLGLSNRLNGKSNIELLKLSADERH